MNLHHQFNSKKNLNEKKTNEIYSICFLLIKIMLICITAKSQPELSWAYLIFIYIFYSKNGKNEFKQKQSINHNFSIILRLFSMVGWLVCSFFIIESNAVYVCLTGNLTAAVHFRRRKVFFFCLYWKSFCQ